MMGVGNDGVRRMDNSGFPSDNNRPMTSYNPQMQSSPSMSQNPPGMAYMPQDTMSTYGYGSGQFNETEIQFKLDGQRILESISHSLLGEIYNPMTNSYDKVTKPLLSVAGVGKIVQILSFSVANVDMRLSKLGSDSISISLEETRNNLRRQLLLDPIFRTNPTVPLTVADIRVILEEVTQCKESLLKRSLDGFTVNKQGFQETHMYQHVDPGQQQGGFSIGKIFR